MMEVDDHDFNDANDDTTGAPTTASESLRSTSASKKIYHHKSKSKRHTRQDLQTVTKLDQFYQSKINVAREEVLKHHKLSSSSSQGNNSQTSTLFHIANTIGNGELILEWALILFPPTARSGFNHHLSATRMITNSDDELEAARDVFVSILSMVLSYCTGIKSRSCAMSPVLSKIAFQSNLMEQLWDYVQVQLGKVKQQNRTDSTSHFQQSVRAFSSASTFCDLFVHHLLAMDDEEFLHAYTDKGSNGKARSSIGVMELIETLKSNLYELYWSRPVVVHNLKLPSDTASLSIEENEGCQRLRFLLSGTKLWNALYQRWSRLYTTMRFCEQECWHFPRLVTREKDEDGAVFDTSDGDSMQDDVALFMDEDDDRNSMDFDDANNDRSGGSVAVMATTADEENDALASSLKDPKMARILTSIPQAIPFDRRVVQASVVEEDASLDSSERVTVQSLDDDSISVLTPMGNSGTPARLGAQPPTPNSYNSEAAYTAVSSGDAGQKRMFLFIRHICHFLGLRSCSNHICTMV